MLKVNVGVSRKLSKDFNSTGFTLNLEGEVAATLDDPEQIAKRIREYFDTAEAALQDQIDRHQSVDAIASRDAEQPGKSDRPNGQTSSKSARPQRQRDGQPSNHRPAEAASNKQVQFVLNLAKRQDLSSEDLEARIAAVLGRSVGLYDLSKREAGQVIDSLTENGAGETRPTRRS
jgi:hypothetical protein